MHCHRKFAVCHALSSLLVPILLASPIHAQNAGSSMAPESAKLRDQVFPLKNTAQPVETKELIIALRNVLDTRATVNVLADQNALVVNDTPDQLRLAQKVIDDIENAQPSIPAQPASATFGTGTQTTMRPDSDHTAEQTLYLPGTMTAPDENELIVHLRAAMSPRTKFYFVQDRHSIVVSTEPGQMQSLYTALARLIPGWSATSPSAVSAVYPIQQASTPTDQVLEQTMYLPAATPQSSSVQVLVALRNILDPNAKVYLVTSRNALVLTATKNQLELATKVLKDLDPNRPAS